MIVGTAGCMVSNLNPAAYFVNRSIPLGCDSCVSGRVELFFDFCACTRPVPKSLFEKWLCLGCADEPPSGETRGMLYSPWPLGDGGSILGQSVSDEQRNLAAVRPADEANALLKQSLKANTEERGKSFTKFLNT